jgi:hypothetical protein
MNQVAFTHITDFCSSVIVSCISIALLLQSAFKYMQFTEILVITPMLRGK